MHLSNKKASVVLLSSLFLIIGCIINNKLIHYSDVLKNQKTALADKLSYKKRFLDKDEWMKVAPKEGKSLRFDGKKISINLPFVSTEELKTSLLSLKTSIQTANNTALQWVYIVLAWIVCYLVALTILHFWLRPPMLLLIGSISLSILCLHIGLFTPMLEIGAIERNFDMASIPIQKTILGFELNVLIQKKFEGDIYFYYQSKSIANLIQLLFKQQNYIVGFCILLFSVLFPILKTILISFFVLRPSIKNKAWFKNIVLNLSKWSMADVFVVAIFLGFLAFENMHAGIITYSNICIGLYFFLCYCILSIVGSVLTKTSTEQPPHHSP
jgi:hypothetical protein